MSILSRTAFVLTAGLVLAGIVHLGSVLAIPRLTNPNADDRLAALVPLHTMTVMPRAEPGSAGLPYGDPAAAVAVCRFDLTEGPVRVEATPGGAFMSFAFYTPTGGVFYALTDRSATRNKLEVVLVTQSQLEELQANDPEDEPVSELRLVAPGRTGFVTVRTLALEPGLLEDAEARLRNAKCTEIDD
jgi:uncharacterized membrane protein